MWSFAVALVLMLFPQLADATPLVGVTFGLDAPPSVLYDVDSASGQASNPRPLSVNALGGITGIEGVDATTFYGLTTFSPDPTEPLRNTLVTIDLETGATLPVGAGTGLPNIVEGDLAYDPTARVMYGIGSNRGMGPNDNMLFTVDLMTGQATELGGLPWTFNIAGLSFDAQGDLYALEVVANNLLRLDPSNGSVISSVPLSAPLKGGVAGMDLDPLSGALFVADGDSQNSAAFELYTLDPATAELSSVGELGLGLGLSGLAVVPEPSSALLLAGGLAALALSRRRR